MPETAGAASLTAAWGSDWYGRAIAAVIYIFVNDYHEAVYLTRGTDSQGQLLNGREHYTRPSTRTRCRRSTAAGADSGR